MKVMAVGWVAALLVACEGSTPMPLRDHERFLAKPVSAEKLLRMVRACLEE